MAPRIAYAGMSMDLSRSSKAVADPLSDVLDVLGARVTRRTRLEAAGQWAPAFPALDRLKFVALLRGAGWMLLPGRSPHRMSAGDVCLLGRTAYAVAGDLELPPLDGQAFYGAGSVARASAATIPSRSGEPSRSPRAMPTSCSACCRISCSFPDPRPHPGRWRRSSG